MSAPATSPMAGAAISRGSRPSAPRTVRVSGAPYTRSCQRPSTASATSAMSRPARWASIVGAWRPRAARRPATSKPSPSVGRTRAAAQATAAAPAAITPPAVMLTASTTPVASRGPTAPEEVHEPDAQDGGHDRGRQRDEDRLGQGQHREVAL